MFTPEERARLRSVLLEEGVQDRRISGGAITGSAAAGQEDPWSDIDLAFGVDGAELPSILSDWTARMYDRHGAIHHVDVKSGAWIYRVFLLSNTLQVDLAFAPAAEFRALAPSFRLVFGKTSAPLHVPPPVPSDIIGMAWLYALHARSSLARGRLWQAEYMISGVRDHALALACIRHGLPAVHGRGMDQLPAEVTAPFQGSLVGQLDADELSRAFEAVISGLIREIRCTDEELGQRLEATLTRLGDPVIRHTL